MKSKNKLIWLISPRKNENCGVFDYSQKISEELRKKKINVEIITNSNPDNFYRFWNKSDYKKIYEKALKEKPDIIIIEYVGWLYGRYGFSFQFLNFVYRLKQAGFRISTMAHETFVQPTNWKWLILTLPQKITFFTILFLSNPIYTPLEKWSTWFKKIFQKKKIVWLPVVSNISKINFTNKDNLKLKKQYYLSALDYIFIMFSPAGSGKDLKKTINFFNQINLKHKKLILIGTLNQDQIDLINNQKDIIITGKLKGKTVSQFFQIADFGIFFYVDGISARRGSAISALSHSLPIITNYGPLSDNIFYKSPLLFEEKMNSKTLSEILTNSKKRKKIRTDTTIFYKKYFSEEKITSKLVETLGFKI